MTRIRIRTISKETKIIYALWVCFMVLTCSYVCLIAATMVYGVDAKVARASIEHVARTSADREARILSASAHVTAAEAALHGLVAVSGTRTAETGVILGRAGN